MLKIIQFQVREQKTTLGDKCIFGLGKDGIIYVWYDDVINKGWIPVTNNNIMVIVEEYKYRNTLKSIVKKMDNYRDIVEEWKKERRIAKKVEEWIKEK